jgi:pyruvate dehydrogenase E1 component alpha subunit
MATVKDLEAIDAKVNVTIAESVKFAEESAFPDPSEAYQDVYAQSDYPYLEDA